MKKYFFLILISVLFLGCNKSPVAEKLPVTVKQNLNLLQQNPQFVMYLNFANMRNSDFWKTFASDSVLKAENELGSLLNIFKNATGVSVTGGLDELYFANSWNEDNSIVLKGDFKKEKLDEYLKNDTNYAKEVIPGSATLYIQKEKNLIFFLKDVNTICASNYRNRINEMMKMSDTSTNGLLSNTEIIRVIENTYYKSSVFMVSNEKSFIRGIFSNFLDTKLKGQDIQRDSMGIPITKDSSSQKVQTIPGEISKSVISLALSTKMEKDLKVSVQFEFADAVAAENFSKIMSGIISLSKISVSMKKDKTLSPGEKILDNIEINPYGNFTQLKLLISKDNIEDFRKFNILGSQGL